MRAKELLSILEKGRGMAESVSELLRQSETDRNGIGAVKSTVDEQASAVLALHKQTEEEKNRAASAAQAAALAEAQATENSSVIKATVAEISPLEQVIKGFFDEVDEYREKIATLLNEANRFLTESNASLAHALTETTSAVASEIDKLDSAAEETGDAQASALKEALESHQLTISDLVDRLEKSEADRVDGATEAFSAQLTKMEKDSTTLLTSVQSKIDELESNLQARSEETIEQNFVETKKHVDELGQLKESVKEQLAQATGLGQFGAFQSRQNKISSGKFLWVGSIGALVTAIVLLTYFIALHAQQTDLHSPAFWIKLSMNIPLGFLITFCTIQYNRERRLEEEYAFKASISVSLNPYRELIYSILEKEGGLKDGRYADFVIDSVRNVFTSPTQKVLDPQNKMEDLPLKSLKSMAEVAGTFTKAAK